MLFLVVWLQLSTFSWACGDSSPLAVCVAPALFPHNHAGRKTPLTAADIWALPPPDRVETLEGRFRTAWDRQLSTRGPKSASLFAACWAAVGHLFLAALPFKLVIDASQFVGPTILNRLLSVVAGRSAEPHSSGWDGIWEHPLQNGYVLAGLLFVGQLTGVLADHQHFQRVQRAGFRLKAIVTAEVYRKVGASPLYQRMLQLRGVTVLHRGVKLQQLLFIVCGAVAAVTKVACYSVSSDV